LAIQRGIVTDGTPLVLPNHHNILVEFGSNKFGTKADNERTLALVSSLYEVLNFIALDSQIDSYDSDERDLLLKHLYIVNREIYYF
jgi:hypothetical protein